MTRKCIMYVCMYVCMWPETALCFQMPERDCARNALISTKMELDRRDFLAAVSIVMTFLRNQCKFIDEERVVLHYYLGNAYSNLGEYESAISAYKSALAFDASLASLNYFLGNALSNAKRYDEAILYYSSAIAINDRFPDFFRYRGDAYMNIGEIQKGKDDYATKERLKVDGASSALIVNDISVLASKATLCPCVDEKKLSELREFSRFVSLKRIFWGDSVVEGVHDSRFLDSNYVHIGQSGQVVKCALSEVELIIGFKPERVVIYLGGNDADGQSYYAPEEAARYYELIVEKLLQNKITPIIHLIHYASSSRRKDYVEQYNNLLKEIAIRHSITTITASNLLSFSLTRDEIRQANNELTYDGEHLKPFGYKTWFDHIRLQLNDF